jgi:hypothetical protein
LLPCYDHFSDTSPVWLSPSWSVNTPFAVALVGPEACTSGDEYSTAESPLFPYLVSQAPPDVVEEEVNEWKSFDEFVGFNISFCTNDDHQVMNNQNVSPPKDNDDDDDDDVDDEADEWKSFLMHCCGNTFSGKIPVAQAAFPVTPKNSRITTCTASVTTSFPAVGYLSSSF